MSIPSNCPVCKAPLEMELTPFALNVCLACGNTCWTNKYEEKLVNSETEEDYD